MATEFSKWSVEQLIAVLASKHGSVRGRAIRELGERKDARAFDALVAAIGDRGARVRSEAATALGLLRDPRAAPPLARMLEDHVVSAVAARALHQLGSTVCIPHFVLALRSASAEARMHAAQRLGMLRCAPAVPHMLPLLEDPEPVARWYTATALGEIGDPRAVDALIAALRDKDKHVAKCAGSALAQMTDTLIATLRNTKFRAESRHRAARGLGHIGGANAERALSASADDPDPELRSEVARSLETLAALRQGVFLA